jgi:serine/threonine protein kinase
MKLISTTSKFEIWQFESQGKYLVLKKLRDNCINKENKQDLSDEFSIINQLSYPCIPKVYELAKESLVMDFVDGVTACDFIFKESIDIFDRNNRILSFAEQGLEILKYVHSQGVIHGDPHPLNFLVKNHKASLIDFGHSVEIGKPLKFWQAVYPYCSPLEALSVSASVDVDLHVFAHSLHLLAVGNVAPTLERLRKLGMTRRDPLSFPHILNRNIPTQLGFAIVKGLQINRKERYTSADEFLSVIKAIKSKI